MPLSIADNYAVNSAKVTRQGKMRLVHEMLHKSCSYFDWADTSSSVNNLFKPFIIIIVTVSMRNLMFILEANWSLFIFEMGNYKYE